METNNIKMYAKEVCKYGFDIASRIFFFDSGVRSAVTEKTGTLVLKSAL